MKLDIAKLRKEKGLNQNELAQKLQITQSYLSSIENGKNQLSPDRELKLAELFGEEELEKFRVNETEPEEPYNSRHLVEMTDSDLFNQLLSRFHRQAHSREEEVHHHGHHERIEALEQRIDALLQRNDSLMQRNEILSQSNDALRAEIDTLRAEIFRLRTEAIAKGR